MTQKTLISKVNKLKALEAEKKAIEKQMETLQNQIKSELQSRGTDEAAAGDWLVRFKEVVSNRFNTKALAADYPMLYQSYMAKSHSMRFTITETT